MRAYILSVLSICISIIALAAAMAHRSQAADEATRIELDQQANIIRIFIDGEQTAQIDGSGLHVREDISFGGVMSDYGRSGFTDHSAQDGKPGK